MTKTCSRCRRILDLDQFSRNRTRKDGRQEYCRECQVARNAAYRAANPEKERARGAARRQANPEKERARYAAWRQANPEKERARNAAYRAANAEKIRAREAAWRAANPDKVRAGHWASKYRSRARRYGVPVVVKPFTLADVVATYGDRCHQCGGPFDELDHYPVAVRDGGAHTLDNVRPSCTPCNRVGRTQKRPKRPAGSEAAA